MKFINFHLMKNRNKYFRMSTSKSNPTIQDSSNLVESFYSKSDNHYVYKLVFKTKNDLNEFLKEVSGNENIITYKTSSIVN